VKKKNLHFIHHLSSSYTSRKHSTSTKSRRYPWQETTAQHQVSYWRSVNLYYQYLWIYILSL